MKFTVFPDFLGHPMVFLLQIFSRFGWACLKTLATPREHILKHVANALPESIHNCHMLLHQRRGEHLKHRGKQSVKAIPDAPLWYFSIFSKRLRRNRFTLLLLNRLFIASSPTSVSEVYFNFSLYYKR